MPPPKRRCPSTAAPKGRIAMSDENTPNTPRKESSRAADAKPADTRSDGPKGAEPSVQPELSQPRAFATEKPVPLSRAKETSQYVVTVNNQTGVAVKIERLNEETGERTELSQAE